LISAPGIWYTAKEVIGLNYTYILRCGDGTLYTGWTNDLEKRLAAHNAGKGGKYTRSRLPVELAYYEKHEAKEDAMRREWQIKQLTREEKLTLIKNKPPV
jgi:putative endonuclease